jgi:hypothetical protein
MRFPSRVNIYRAQEMSRYVVTVLNEYGSGHHWGCVATGATAQEADDKASMWTWQNVERAAAKGCLLARLGILERELSKLSDALSTR